MCGPGPPSPVLPPVSCLPCAAVAAWPKCVSTLLPLGSRSSFNEPSCNALFHNKHQVFFFYSSQLKVNQLPRRSSKRGSKQQKKNRLLLLVGVEAPKNNNFDIALCCLRHCEPLSAHLSDWRIDFDANFGEFSMRSLCVCISVCACVCVCFEELFTQLINIKPMRKLLQIGL